MCMSSGQCSCVGNRCTNHMTPSGLGSCVRDLTVMREPDGQYSCVGIHLHLLDEAKWAWFLCGGPYCDVWAKWVVFLYGESC